VIEVKSFPRTKPKIIIPTLSLSQNEDESRVAHGIRGRLNCATSRRMWHRLPFASKAKEYVGASDFAREPCARTAVEPSTYCHSVGDAPPENRAFAECGGTGLMGTCAVAMTVAAT